MGNPQNRTRIVYFRVSEDEFRHLHELCQQRGARNLSELVRSTIEKVLHGSQHDGFESEINRRLELLEQSVSRLHTNVTESATGER
jgi:hypothetical protein